MTSILLENTLKHLQALVAFNTGNPPRQIHESGIIDYLTEQLSDGQVEVMDYGDGSINVWAVKGQPKYLFNFHIDTVPVAQGWETDPFALIIKDDKAFGLGSCDIKGAAACFLACVEQGLNDYAVLFSSDEEYGNSLCVKSFLQQQHDYEGVVVAEPTQCKAVLAHRGVATAEILFTAKSGHSSEPRALTENAIHQATSWMSQAIEWATGQLQSSYYNLQGACLNLGKIEGGIKPNIIAPHVTLQMGIRPLPGDDPEHLLQEMVSSIDMSQPVTVTPKFMAPSFPATKTSEHSDEQQTDNVSLANKLGLELSEPVNFWTEAALFSAAGYAAIVYGPGNIDKAHTANEWVAISDLETVVMNYWRILGDD
ncbi:acetylornithine deacetylase [Kangiella koreensis]|uniref:N-acetyl-L-citrulline deacetylase n=1 Tax=Kangiella koreensis (strain DSM 16069 / JCM 12317 / KCTC 12182 / SW-125) TaxID=523791 RepID=C7R8V2_KANKD|nr:acetylornithine deacetylase [Kangiella koreensis]ACV25965.1 peptidase M20 [Kangiella koreensis DSM 16069]